MFKRVTIVALVVAAFLVLAVPALAFNGYRSDYTTSQACQTCHSGTANIPAVYNQWAGTKHAVAGEDDQALRLPYGSVCQGCHTSNFSPAKVVPTPSGTTYVPANGIPTEVQTVGNAASSENYVGCSSCHYGANVAGGLEIYGVDTNDTAHEVPMGEMANADICGACHSRYSYTVDTFSVSPVPLATPTSLIQPQMAIGYPMLGAPNGTGGWNPAAALDTYLTYPQPGWTPLPDPAATSAGLGRLMTYWQILDAPTTKGVGASAATDTMWQQIGHDGSAAQYPEWRSEGHANSLTVLTSMPFWASFPEATKQECLECHSADFRNLKEAGDDPTSSDVKYGITCVGCHAPHDSGDITGVWSEEFDAQLVNNDELDGNGSNLCTECHNGEIPVGSTASPGAEVHHPMREMMDGYGAIDVSAFPSVHKGKCIQCHMPPTSYSRGAVQMGGNHTFTIIEPEVAAEEVSPIPVATATARATALPIPGATNLPVVTTTITKSWSRMPYSACSTCHDNNPKPDQVITSATTTATPTASPTAVQVTVNREVMVASGDKGLWLQDTIDQRQSWTHAKIDEIHDALDAAAVRLGYADATAAQEALVAIPEADRSAGETLFLKAWTNVQYVESEGSFGLHNWDYSREIVNVALAQARSAEPVAPRPWVVSLALSRTSITKGQKVFFRGVVQNGWGLAAQGTVELQKRRAGGTWATWKTATLAVNGSYSISLKVKLAKGKWYFRSFMPSDGGKNLAANSRNSLLRIN
jgi:nitrate/TMAO reductase-like tetraheme cytochrome c subunit